MPLTIKQSRFVDAYLLEPNGKKAAVSAGYSPTTAEKAGSRLLRHRGVAAELKRLQELRKGGPVEPAKTMTPLEFLMSVMNDETNTTAQRTRAAMAAIPYTHAKPAVGGKKDAALEAGRRAASKYATRTGPSLGLVRPFVLKEQS